MSLEESVDGLKEVSVRDWRGGKREEEDVVVVVEPGTGSISEVDSPPSLSFTTSRLSKTSTSLLIKLNVLGGCEVEHNEARAWSVRRRDLESAVRRTARESGSSWEVECEEGLGSSGFVVEGGAAACKTGYP